MKLLTFSEALVLLKEGNYLARQGWNGKNLFVRLITKNNINIKDFDLEPFFIINTKNNTFCTWVPSVSDLIAEDWIIIK